MCRIVKKWCILDLEVLVVSKGSTLKQQIHPFWKLSQACTGNCCHSKKSLIWTAWVAQLLTALQQPRGHSSRSHSTICVVGLFLPRSYDVYASFSVLSVLIAIGKFIHFQKSCLYRKLISSLRSVYQCFQSRKRLAVGMGQRNNGFKLMRIVVGGIWGGTFHYEGDETCCLEKLSIPHPCECSRPC